MTRVALLLALALLATVAALADQSASKSPRASFTVVEATILDMQRAMAAGHTSARYLVTQYLVRIAMYNGRLNATMSVNRNALQEADERDRERAQERVSGLLHGIPVALKDNIHTTDLPTTAGAMAFEHFVPPYEATLTKRLREAGAIIIAKTRLNEFAGWVTGGPTPAPNNYNAITGFGLSPYDPRKDPRDATNDGRPALPPGGSSYGGGTAANLWAADIGTDTTGSLLGPSNLAMLVGLRPTLARISRYGVVPVTTDQDMTGPMTRTVADAAILLGILEGDEPDPNDPATGVCTPPPGKDYTRFLDPNGLKGARIGVPRAYFYEPVTPPGTTRPRGGITAAQAASMTAAIAVLEGQGAVVVDPGDFPSVTSRDPDRNYALFDICADGDKVRGKDGDCSVVLKYGMKRDFNAWLATLGPNAPVKTLTELRMWNMRHILAGAMRYGMGRMNISDEVNLERDRARYEADRAKDLALARTDGFDAVMKAHKLDALIFPGSSGSDIADRAGYPSIQVPFGMAPNEPTPPFPEGFSAKPGPYGVNFKALACSEPKLIAIAYAFEQATRRRVPPPLFP